MSDETEANSPSSAPVASSARARAEARRRRILEKSKDRMSVVSGATIPTNDMNTNESPNEKDGSPNNADGKEEGLSEISVTDDVNLTANVTATAGSPASKGSTRLAQMRRRRYKKTTAKAGDTIVKDTPSTQNVTEKGNAESKDEIQADTEIKTSQVTAVKGGKEGEENKPPTEKKKYLGVVKMRRKMLAEKKASEAQTETNTIPSTTTKNASSKRLKLSKKEKNAVSLGPILVQFMTVMLLFLAGFDVGVQNHVVVNQNVPTIHTNFAISEHGIGVMKLVGISASSSQNPIGSNTIIDQDLFQLNDQGDEEFLDSEEEFGDAKPKGASTTSKKEPNIDPVFGVDFDELTAGDGILFTLFRIAVSFHRMFTHFFFTVPLAFIYGLLALPKRILANPPILFLCAVSIRFVGKHLLGGSLPDLDKMLQAEINDNDAMKGKEGVADTIANTDLVSLGTNFVKNFFKTNFPKLVLFWTIFNDARSDMFVVFCGFFTGLVLPSGLLSQSYSVSEEL